MPGTTVRIARRLILDWVLLSSAGLPDRMVRERFEEVASDLWEQERASTHTPAVVVGASMLARSMGGITADLAWRRGALRRPTSLATRTWIPLTGKLMFDQTNGVVAPSSDLPTHRVGALEDDLVARAVASNTVNAGFFGGTWF